MKQLFKIREFVGHRQSIYSICAGKSGYFYSAGSDGWLVRWRRDHPDGELLAQVPEPLFSCAVSPDERFLAFASREGTLYLLDLVSRQLQAQWKAHASAVFEVFFQDGFLVSAGEDGVLRAWQLNGSPLWEQVISDSSLRCVLPDAEGWWVGSSDGRIYRFNPEHRRIESSLEGHEQSVFALALTGNRLYSAGRDARIRVWNPSSGEQEKFINAHWYSIHALAASPDGQWLLSGSMDKTIRLWDLPSLELKKVIDTEKYEAHTSSVNRIVWLDNQHFVSCSDDRRILLFGTDNVDNHEGEN